MKIAIQGHPTRGKEVIKILESLGGKNVVPLQGTGKCYYYIESSNIYCHDHEYVNKYCKKYTLEEFEKEFPFKIEDGVIFPVKIGWASGKVTGLTYIEDKLKYEVNTRTAGYHYVEPHKLQLYPMKKERNITLTLDKAKEWYKKGGELKEVALQAYSEEEITKVELPKSWEEFCKNYSMKNGECFIHSCCTITTIDKCVPYRDIDIDRNICPSQKSAEAHLAMIQLEQLRDCWRQGWKPTKHDTGFCIVKYPEEYYIMAFSFICFLSFPTKKMAEEFLKCFRDLIEKAGDLI